MIKVSFEYKLTSVICIYHLFCRMYAKHDVTTNPATRAADVLKTVLCSASVGIDSILALKAEDQILSIRILARAIAINWDVCCES